MTEIIKYISGPLVGSVIGYFTNYIAVKMLFRPYREIKFLGIKLPFTPGIIPKRRKDLAKAIGKAISQTLFTSSDLEKNILSEENKRKIADMILAKADTSDSADMIIKNLAGEQAAEKIKVKTAEFICGKLVDAAIKINAGKIVSEAGREVIEEKKQSLGMFAFFISDGVLDPLLESLAEKINEYIEEKGRAKLFPVICEYIGEYKDKPLSELINPSARDKLSGIIVNIIGKAASGFISGFLADIDIAGTVESKINAMDIKELEALCLSVMKKELNAIVNLGALIGFVIGIINIFI